MVADKAARSQVGSIMIPSIRSLRARTLPGVALTLASSLALVSSCAEPPATKATTFAAFVDRYLDDFTRRHPSIAAGNGLHSADSTLDDFSADAIAREIADLKRDQAELQAFRPDDLTPDEQGRPEDP